MNNSIRTLNRIMYLAHAKGCNLVYKMSSTKVDVEQKTLNKLCDLISNINRQRSGSSTASHICGDENFRLRCLWLPRQELFVNMACTGVGQPKGSSQLSISLMKEEKKNTL